MSILYLLIPIGVLFLGVAIGLLIWAIRSGQYEDMEGPAWRILMDDDDPRIPGNRTRQEASSGSEPPESEQVVESKKKND